MQATAAAAGADLWKKPASLTENKDRLNFTWTPEHSPLSMKVTYTNKNVEILLLPLKPPQMSTQRPHSNRSSTLNELITDW